MSYPPSATKTWTSEILHATDLNNEFVAVRQQLTPENINDFSSNVSQAQTTSDPYPAGVVSLASDLSGEIARIRYVLAQITGESAWYVDPDSSIASLVSSGVSSITMNGEASRKWIAPGTCTISIASPAVVSKTGHGMSIGDPVVFTTTGALPTGLTAGFGAVYWIITDGFTADAFQVSTQPGGSAVNTSGTQSGTQSVERAAALNFGAVTAGDRIFISGRASAALVTGAATGYIRVYAIKASGATATGVFGVDGTSIEAVCTSIAGASLIVNPTVSGVYQVTGNGNLQILVAYAKDAGTSMGSTGTQIHGFFLKKQ